MTEFPGKLKAILEVMEQEKGPFAFFAAVRRREGLGLWDVLVSAPWLSYEDPESVRYFFDQWTERLSQEDLLRISRGVILTPPNPFLQEFARLIRSNGGRVPMEWRDVEFGGLEFDRDGGATQRRRPAGLSITGQLLS